MQKFNVKKNTIFNSAKTVFGIIYPLITFPYISRVLMAEKVGKVNSGNSIVRYFSLIASLGVSTYAIRECSKVRDSQDELSNTASQIFSINIISTLISYFALAVTLFVARPLDNYRELSQYIAETQKTYAINEKPRRFIYNEENNTQIFTNERTSIFFL